jgi:hypothetical protein
MGVILKWLDGVILKWVDVPFFLKGTNICYFKRGWYMLF